MRITLDRRGLYVVFRLGNATRRAIGFKIKSKHRRLFSEREGMARGLCIGPVYCGTFGSRAMRASPDRAETVKQGSVSEANSTRSGEAGGAQDLTRVRIGDGQ